MGNPLDLNEEGSGTVTLVDPAPSSEFTCNPNRGDPQKEYGEFVCGHVVRLSTLWISLWAFFCWQTKRTPRHMLRADLVWDEAR